MKEKSSMMMMIRCWNKRNKWRRKRLFENKVRGKVEESQRRINNSLSSRKLVIDRFSMMGK
jgi:hypothetical protein